ncbi:leucine-rich repeat domain-containing protein [Mycoplasma sp. 654]|uniref:leucine-rich repeat domain-containing protein n=1 Tax=Mycoplasma sp. 654 TaxID=3398773 RepID=UPI003A8773E8
MKRNKLFILLGFSSLSVVCAPLVAGACNKPDDKIIQTNPSDGSGDRNKEEIPALIDLKSSDPNVKMEFNKETKVMTIKNAPTITYKILSEFISKLDDELIHNVGDITLECPDTKTIWAEYPGDTSIKVKKLIAPKLESVNGYIQRIFGAPKRPWLFKNLSDDKVIINGLLIKWDNASGNIADPNVTKIVKYAFMDTAKITGVDFPNVKNIDGKAFLGPEGKIFPDINDKIVLNGILIKYPNATGEINDDSIKKIFPKVFYGNDKITSVSFPNVTEIDYCAFENAKNLILISAPKLEVIGNSAFYNAESLKMVSFPKVTTIGEFAFYNNKNLEHIEFPEVKSIDKAAFNMTPKLPAKMIINKILVKWDDAKGEVSDNDVTAIVGAIFRDNKEITSASFPNVTNISDALFENAEALTTVSFPKATNISDYAFKKASSLTNIDAPNVTRIGNEAFKEAIELTSVSFPKVTFIDTLAFSGAIKLKTADFPKLEQIGDAAFSGADHLEKIPTVTKN